MFLGYKKNFDYKKNQKKLIEEFVKSGEQTQKIFADILFPLKHIGIITQPKDIKKLITFIHNNVKRNEGINNRKFERTAKEIWVSKRAESCADYTLVFETITRQLNIPTIHLQMVNANWKTSSKTERIIEGHHACECFVGNKWIYVDPTCGEIIENYDSSKLNIYSTSLGCSYEIFSKSTDIFETNVHNNKENSKTILKLYPIKTIKIEK